jgi:MAPEG family
VRWKADNYNNLMEQPTLFYAVTLALALLGAGEGLNTGLAWLYVGLRVPQPHSGDHQHCHAPLHHFHGGVARSAGDVGACGAYRLIGCEVTHGTRHTKEVFPTIVSRFTTRLGPPVRSAILPLWDGKRTLTKPYSTSSIDE